MFHDSVEITKRIPKGFNVCRIVICNRHATPKGSNVHIASSLQTFDAFDIVTRHSYSEILLHDDSEEIKKRIPKAFNVCRNETQSHATPRGSNVHNASSLQTFEVLGIFTGHLYSEVLLFKYPIEIAK
jgi:hypothetical protein